MSDNEMLKLWDRQENEPREWYERFVTYYLDLGPSRSIRKAYITFMKLNEPDRAMKQLNANNFTPALSWTEMSQKWEWRKRAMAHDASLMSDAKKMVQEARRTLLESAPKAAEALLQALSNNRTRVAAAKEILNRAGLPSTETVDMRVRPYTADELAAAREDLQEWEQEKIGSGENT